MMMMIIIWWWYIMKFYIYDLIWLDWMNENWCACHFSYTIGMFIWLLMFINIFFVLFSCFWLINYNKLIFFLIWLVNFVFRMDGWWWWSIGIWLDWNLYNYCDGLWNFFFFFADAYLLCLSCLRLSKNKFSPPPPTTTTAIAIRIKVKILPTLKMMNK